MHTYYNKSMHETRTTIALPDEMIEFLRKKLGINTKKDIVMKSLEEMVQKVKLRELKKFCGAFPDFKVDTDRFRGRTIKNVL